MYELADGLRIPMWRAITSCECATSTQTWSRKNLGGKVGIQWIFFKGKLGNNYHNLTGLALRYLIITGVLRDFSLGWWPWGGARTTDILTKERNMLTQCTRRDTLIALSAESQLERKKAVEVQKAWLKNWMWWSAARARRLLRPPPPPSPPIRA